MYRAWSGLKGLAKRRQIDHCSLTYVHPFPRTYSRWSTQDIPDLTVHGGLRLHVSERLYDGTPPGVVMGCCLRLTALVVFYSHQAAMNCALRISLDSQWWSHLVCRSQRPGLRVKLDAWASGFRHESDWWRKLNEYRCEVWAIHLHPHELTENHFHPQIVRSSEPHQWLTWIEKWISFLEWDHQRLAQ